MAAATAYDIASDFDVVEAVEPLAMRVLQAVDSLKDERRKRIIKMRFGLANEEPMSLAAIAQREGVTRERIRQLVARAYRELRFTPELEAEPEAARYLERMEKTKARHLLQAQLMPLRREYCVEINVLEGFFDQIQSVRGVEEELKVWRLCRMFGVGRPIVDQFIRKSGSVEAAEHRLEKMFAAGHTGYDMRKAIVS